MTTTPAARPRRYRYDWALFADWCHAADLPSLPAAPSTLALFLAEHPATVSTQRARVTAINWHHDHTGLPAPGRADTIRDLLDERRAHRLRNASELLRQQIPHFPTDGWPQGLFGRRDATLLLIAAAGIPLQHITRLQRRHLICDGEALVVDTGRYRYRLEPTTGDPDLAPAAVYRRWAQVLAFTDRHPSTRTLAAHLTRGTLPDITDDPSPEGLVFTPIDRWGYLPLPPQPLTVGSIAAIVRQHLTGTAPTHTLPPRRPRPAPAASDPTPMPEPPPLSDEYYDRGTAARRDALTALADVGDMLDDVEARADTLLEQTLALIENWQLPDPISTTDKEQR
ncbi:site-specific integrase [Prescottella equi]